MHPAGPRAAVAAPVAPGQGPPATHEVPFPALVVIGPGQPQTVLDAYGCKPASPGVYHAVWGLVLRVVARIEAADVADLERWGERILDARTLAEVLDGQP